MIGARRVIARHTAHQRAAIRALGLIAAVLAAGPALACVPGANDLGVTRIVEIDAREGPVFGRATKFARQPSFLKRKEVVLTFDDGPTPGVTTRVLDELLSHCTRATFFPIGKRAVQFPDLIARIEAEGHTLGGHTWSHPKNLRRLKAGAARDQIERGFAAVALAATAPLAPFFRFPGLNDGRDLLAYTQSRKLAVFSVDVISDDSYSRSTAELVRTTRRRTRANDGGIVLFHDLKRRTARALPEILRNLKRDGFRVVHVVSALPFKRDPNYDSTLKPLIEKSRSRRGSGPKERLARVPLGLTVPVTTLFPTQARFDGKQPRRKSATPQTAAAQSEATDPASAQKKDETPVAKEDDGTPMVKVPGWRTTIGPGFDDGGAN
ncbi:MAG: polysaccharide deacetylase family protein [Pseudomonadota bacterium]